MTQAHEAYQDAYADEVGRERALRIDGVRNARDLGGLSGTRGKVRSGMVLRAACLSRLTEQGAQTLTDLGVRTIIDLRTPLERLEEPNRLAGNEDLGVRELHVELLETLWDLPETSMELYQHLIDRCGTGIVEVLEYLTQPDSTPALVHCMVGKDRTGLTVALLLDLLGVPRETIVADYMASNAGLGDEVRTLVRADVLEHTLAGLDEKYGSPLAYLTAHGLTPEAIDALRSVLLVDH